MIVRSVVVGVFIAAANGLLRADTPQPPAVDMQGQKIIVAPEPLLAPTGHTTEVFTVVVSPDGRRLASASNKEVKVWDATTGKEVSSYAIKGTNVYGLAFSPDGTRLAVGISKQLKLLDPANGNEITSFPMSAQFLFRLAFSPDGKQLAAASGSSGTGPGECVVWEAATGKQLYRLSGHTNGILAVAYSPDGRLLATAGGATTGSLPGTIKLWDPTTGSEMLTLAGHPENIYAIAFSPDGRRLASGAGQSRGSPKPGSVKVWEVVSGAEVAEFGGYGGPVFAVAYSPDGRRLATAGGDKVIRVRDPVCGQVLSDWTAHTSTIFSLAFTPDGKRLASAGQDKCVKVWDAPNHVRAVPPADVPKTAREARALWTDVAGADAVRAYQALFRLVAAPELAVPALAERLKPVAPPTAPQLERTAAWVRDLDNKDFRVRERASRALADAGEATGAALRAGLTASPSPEARERIERLLKAPKIRTPTADEIAAIRAVEALEHIGSAEARNTLRLLATGYPEARLTRDAAAALARVEQSALKAK